MRITLAILRGIALAFAALVLLPTLAMLSGSLFSFSLMPLIGGVVSMLPLAGFILFFFLSQGAQTALRQNRRMSSGEAKKFIWAIAAGTVASVLSTVIIWTTTGINNSPRIAGVLIVLLPIAAGITAWLVYAYRAIQQYPEAPDASPAAPKSPPSS